ncbi:hypothetical protein CFOL_v3_36299 [Cephalotus follicularis]|uniref:Uncharacterized protein n=1 Tax=Cephalotus follicularis TaxID=3775 RepID=A0A1Q3DKD2_CEPFO|nr:hypothetical protein CFOL_v3_36299 [Cephalotus follicularis]
MRPKLDFSLPWPNFSQLKIQETLPSSCRAGPSSPKLSRILENSPFYKVMNITMEETASLSFRGSLGDSPSSTLPLKLLQDFLRKNKYKGCNLHPPTQVNSEASLDFPLQSCLIYWCS